MNSLFILGNGFDLAHGLPTMYKDFRSAILKNYPNAGINRDEQFDIYDYFEMYEDEFAAEILVYAIDSASGLEWNDFENALAHINFYDKFPRRTESADMSREEDNKDARNYLLAVDIISNAMISSTKYCQGFFRCWVKDVEQELESRAYAPKESLIELFANPTNQYLTFNYTKTLQKLYGIRKVIHIHNRVGQKLIFGHGNDQATYKEPIENSCTISSSFLNDLLLSFRKDTVTPIKKYSDSFKKLDGNIDKVYSYGFSYSKVDSIYIKTIIKRIATNATWYFTDYESFDKEALRIKKIKLRRYGFKGDFGIYQG